MALRIFNYETPSGLVSPSAYAKIDTLYGSKELRVDVHIFASKEAEQEQRPAIDQQSFTFNPIITENSLNYHIQAYDFLKTQDIFKDAVDA